jgi:hypothetical protein
MDTPLDAIAEVAGAQKGIDEKYLSQLRRLDDLQSALESVKRDSERKPDPLINARLVSVEERIAALEQRPEPQAFVETALAHTIKDKTVAAYRRGDALERRLDD